MNVFIQLLNAVFGVHVISSMNESLTKTLSKKKSEDNTTEASLRSFNKLRKRFLECNIHFFTSTQTDVLLSLGETNRLKSTKPCFPPRGMKPGCPIYPEVAASMDVWPLTLLP